MIDGIYGVPASEPSSNVFVDGDEEPLMFSVKKSSHVLPAEIPHVSWWFWL